MEYVIALCLPRARLTVYDKYLPHNGVASPGQIIEAVQTGFNMEYQLAVIVTYGAFLVNGNHLTNLLSIGL